MVDTGRAPAAESFAPSLEKVFSLAAGKTKALASRWEGQGGAPVFTAHVVVEPGVLAGGSAALLSRLQGCLSEHFDVEHSTFQMEPAGHREHDAHT